MAMNAMNRRMIHGFYEGCGREGPVRSIFLCEFHPTAGPKITFQVPYEYISKEKFDAVSVYLIPKRQLQRSILTVNVLGYKITGYPVWIDSSKYARNAYYFNLCFVCDAWARTVQYESVIKKMSEYLVTMEVENGFLSKENKTANDQARICNMLERILSDINIKKMCTISGNWFDMKKLNWLLMEENIDDTTPTLHLKVVDIASDPPHVHDHQVPLFIVNEESFQPEQWDLTTQQILPFIDGFNHVAKIAAEADVENNLVKACIQNLVYYGIVYLIPIFQYSNMYSATPLLKNLSENKDLQAECIQYVSKSENNPAIFRDIFLLYCNMTYGVTLKDLCLRFNSNSLRIDEMKLVQYGLLYGYIRRIHKYPVSVGDSGCNYNGVSSYDEISCSTGHSSSQIDDIVESNPTIHLIWK